MKVLESPAVEDSFQHHAPDKAGIRKMLASVRQGAVGALISSVCCVLPAVAIAIGLTGGLAATLVSLGRFRLYGIIAGLAFVVIASWFSLRRSRSRCNDEQYKRLKITVPLTMLASFGLVYLLTMYLILPLLYKLG